MDFHDGGKLDEAVEAYRRAVDTDPSFVIAHNNLGMVYIDKGEFPLAIAALKRAVQVDPTYAEAYNNLGYVHRKINEDPLAAAYYEKFIALDPEVDDSAKILQWALKIKAQLGALPSIVPGAASQEESATPDIGSEDRTLIMNNPPADLMAALAGTPAAEPGGAPVAEPVPGLDASPPPAVPAAASPPPVMPPPSALASPPVISPEEAQARENAEKTCEKGIAAFESGDLAQAEALLREAVSMNAALGVARSALGRVLAKAGRYEEAAEELREAVTLDPADAAAFYVLGFALKTLGMEHEAAEAYEQFLDLTPDAPEGPKIRSWVENVRANPDLTPAELLAQASAGLQAGRVDEAAVACEQVLASDAGNAAANILMGRILFQKSDYIRATTVLKRAETAMPDDAEIPFLLGQAYSERSQADEATQAFERCLQLAPDGPNAATAREWLESISGPQAAPVGGQCGYCFRSFAEDDLSSHDGKMACRDCLASLGAETGGAQAAPSVAVPTGMGRAAAIAAERDRRKRSGAKIVRILLAGGLALFILLGLLLLMMKNGWMQGPLDTIGVYSVVRALGLEGPFKSIGIEMPADSSIGSVDDTDPKDPGDGDNGGGKQPAAKPLAIVGPTEPVRALPLGQLAVEIKTHGGEGKPAFKLLSGPPGMEIDPADGTIRWRPFAGAAELKLPVTHAVEIEAATPEGDSATCAFEVVVDLTFKEGRPIDAGVPAGDQVHLAVGKLNTTSDRDPDTVAVAWGRYRKGFVRLLRQSAPGRFTRGDPLPLEGQPSSLVVADVTGDGRADAVVANWFRSRIHVLRQDETGNIAQDVTLPTAKGVCDLAAGRIDTDDRTDVAAAHWAAPRMHVYLQSAEGDGPGRLFGSSARPTTRPSGWNRIFVGPIHGGAKGGIIYLLCGSATEPFFKVFPVMGRTVAPYEPSKNAKLLPERPLEAKLLRAGDGFPCIAALVGGEKPSLHLLGADGNDVVEVARAEIELPPFPIAMEVADLNLDGFDDVVVLYPDKLSIHINAGGRDWRFHALGVVAIPDVSGPLVVGEFTGDDFPDLLVALKNGKLLVVKATVEVKR
jgi:tetratricopeptide (TPR) repeat protein